MATAQQVYDEAVRTLALSERLRLATMILNDLAATAAPVLGYSDTWTAEDVRDITTRSLAYADSLYPAATEAGIKDMAQDVAQLNASLHQLSSTVDSLLAAHLDCEKRSDWRLFPLMSEGLVIRIRELNTDIRQYLRTHAEEGATPPVAAANP